ncbi:hypothetical protein INT43_006424 [Umbelopsis isabellina]|uniref:Edg1 TPR repeats region domain-containing protein n=1 Tax=Mortierella isabellina TaxID=91625 RepID=A0A8H7Q124_MORIS|nr:hypothetical protein INT43_006424 [Umbelopsis isabellina]
MQHLLKADVEGVLEHVSNLDRSSSKESLSETVTSLIIQEVHRTGECMNKPDFCHQTHDLLFRAWQQNLGIYDPYAKFHHRNGLTTDEYYKLVDKLSLWNELAQTLYSLSPEHALDILHCLRISRPDSKLPLKCLAMYYTVCCSFPSQDIVQELLQHPPLNQLEGMSSLDSASIASILKSMCTILAKLNTHSHDYSKPHHPAYQDAAEQIPQIFSNIYETFKKLSFPHSSRISRRNKHMYRLFWTEFCRNPLSRLIGIVENDLLQTFLKESEDWGHVSQFNNAVEQPFGLEHQQPSMFDIDETLVKLDMPLSDAANKHLMAFVKIYGLINSNCPLETMQANESLNVQTSRAMDKQGHGILTTTEDTTVTQEYVNDCLLKIQHQSTGWISFLELVVDFQDLFWSYFDEDAHLYDLITKAIVTENLHWRFFKRLSHNVILHQQSEDFIELQCIQCLTGLLIAVFKAISNRDQRLAFRNQIIYSSYQNGNDRTGITYGSMELWSRKRILECTTELRITCNQIVEQSDISSDSNLTHNSNNTLIDSLCWLSMIMPYAVLKRLVLGCIDNKGQTSAVHSILQKLGELCSLKASSNEEPLLITVLNSQEVAESMSSLHNRRNYTDLICQWTMVETTYTNKDEDNKDRNEKGFNRLTPLLDIIEYFEWCLIPGLSKWVRLSSDEVALLPASLQLLHLTLSPIMEMKPHANLPLANDEQSKSNSTQNRSLDWLLHINVIQLISDLCALLALRNKLEDTQQSHELEVLSFLRFTDWEACMSSLDSLLHMLLPDLNVKAPTDNLRRILDHDGAQGSTTVLVDRYSGFDWSLQIKVYPLLNRIADHYGFEKMYISLPTGLLDFFNGVEPIFVADEADPRDKWTLLMLTCKSTTWIQDVMLKNLSLAEHFNTVSLHPYDNVGFVTGIYHALLPAKTLSVLPEFKRLLADFLGQVFNLSPIPQSIRDYKYGNESLNTLVKLLMKEDLQILYSILYSKMLLQTYTSISNYQYGQASSSMGEDEHDNEAVYFVSSIMRVIQSLQPWSSIHDNGITDMDSQPFPEYLNSVMPELHNVTNGQEVSSEAFETDWNKSSDSVENEFDAYLKATSNQEHSAANRTQFSTANNMQHIELLFPPESQYNLSKVSLSVITLFILSQIKDQFQVKKLRESIWIFMLQIVEGLSSDPRRRRLVQAAGKAGKASIKNWKKKTGVKHIVRCRPLLNDDQIALVRQSLTLLQDQQESHIIGQKLDVFYIANSKLPRYYL